MDSILKDEEFKEELKKNRTKKIVTMVISLALIIGGIITMILLHLAFYSMTIGFVVIIAGLIFLGVSAVYFSFDKNSIVDRFMKDFKAKTDIEYFGENLSTPGWVIDKEFLLKNNPTEKEWDEAKISGNYEGYSGGVHFSAANVTLIGEKRKSDLSVDNITDTEKYDAFEGVFISLETKIKAESDFLLCFKKKMGGDVNPLQGDLSDQYTIWADDPEYGKKFASRYEKLLRRLYEENRYTPHICYAGNRLNIGIPTIDIRFRAINGKTDIGDIDTFRDSYIKSLELVKNTIDIVREETDLL